MPLKNILLPKKIYLAVLFTNFLYSQNTINLDVDNDLYFAKDFYYSSGIFLTYSKFAKSKNEKALINHFTIGQEIYTPSSQFFIKDEVYPRKYDYPYSGWLFFKYKNQRALTDTSSLSLSGKLGITGSASLAKGMQNLYHRLALNLPDLLWNAQMPQEVHLNFLINYFKGFNVEENVNLETKLFSEVGTYQIKTGLDVGIMIGLLDSFHFFDNIMNMKQNKLSFYLGTRQEYYFHDFNIEGSLFNDNASLTMKSKKYRNIIQVGLLQRLNKFQILTTFNSMSQDNYKQRFQRHPYLKISITYLLD
ncbi:MAG: lipid A deacylase LpxR family protein [Flavobacteriales bacterium]|nr:lipid A deacylase LpxR family protein [Flavobacteriales bacterium]